MGAFDPVMLDDGQISHLPSELYRAFLAYMPVVCVDLIVKNAGDVLLVRRANNPLRGYMWVPGGRIGKGEKAVDAARRKLKAETGLEANNFRFAGFYEDFYSESAFGVPCHSISIVFEADVDSREVTLNEESLEYKWESRLPEMFRSRLVL